MLGRFRAGDGIAELAKDYDTTIDFVAADLIQAEREACANIVEDAHLAWAKRAQPEPVGPCLALHADLLGVLERISRRWAQRVHSGLSAEYLAALEGDTNVLAASPRHLARSGPIEELHDPKCDRLGQNCALCAKGG